MSIDADIQAARGSAAGAGLRVSGRLGLALRRKRLRPLFVLRGVVGAQLAVAGCSAGSVERRMSVGDSVPSQLNLDNVTTIVLATVPEDCYGCKLQEAFIAVRQAQRGGSTHRAQVVVVLVTNAPKDSVGLSEILRAQRIDAPIRLLKPSEAERVISASRLPAVYVVYGGVVAGRWEAGASRLTLRRDELSHALGVIR